MYIENGYVTLGTHVWFHLDKVVDPKYAGLEYPWPIGAKSAYVIHRIAAKTVNITLPPFELADRKLLVENVYKLVHDLQHCEDEELIPTILYPFTGLSKREKDFLYETGERESAADMLNVLLSPMNDRLKGRYAKIF